eukprot:Opistho-2@39505
MRPAAVSLRARARHRAPRHRAGGKATATTSRQAPQELFQDDAGRCGIGVFRPQAVGLGGAVALVHLEHRQAMAAAQLAGELQRARGVLVGRAVGVVRHAHHQGVGLPFLQALRDLHEARVALGGNGGLRRGTACEAVAGGHAGAFQAEVERQEQLAMRRDFKGRGRRRVHGHAWPASGESIQGCRPSRAMARS